MDTVRDLESYIAFVKSLLSPIENMLATFRNEWASFLPSAHSAMTMIETLQLLRNPQIFAETLWMVQVLQRYAYHDADEGSIKEIVTWCQTAWLEMLQHHPESVEILTGVITHPYTCKPKRH